MAEVATTKIAGDGVALFYGAIVLLALSWIVFSMRVIARVVRKTFGLDDYFMTIGVVRMRPGGLGPSILVS